MAKNVFKLNLKQLNEIALDFKNKVETGLSNDDGELKCIPFFIHPLDGEAEGEATVLDLSGTNYRAAAVHFVNGKIRISSKSIVTKDLAIMKMNGFPEHELLSKQSEFINEIKLPVKSSVGYCFSHPVKSQIDGDAELIKWTDGVDIPEMVGKPVGKSLLAYLNQKGEGTFTGIKVINGTLAALFAGQSYRGFDAYIGLNVGRVINMAAFINADRILKINPNLGWLGPTPVDLQSANFNPPHLTEFDYSLDEKSENSGLKRFEKAVSVKYIPQIFKELFPEDEFNDKFETRGLTDVINRPIKYRKRHVKAAKRIYKRSAILVAAALAGMIDLLVSHDSSVINVKITAKGALFWSKVKDCPNYKKVVNRTLNDLLFEMGHKHIRIDIAEIENVNMIGTGIAALS